MQVIRVRAASLGLLAVLAFPTVRAQGPADVAALPTAVSNSEPIVSRFGQAELTTGVTLRYVERGDPNGRAVILLHGYADSWFSFSRVLPKLDDRLHVYALDQRGHGESGRPQSGYAMKDLARDVIAFMDAKDIRSAILVGHSMGSFVAQQVALAAPSRVSGLVLVGSATSAQKIVDVADLKAAVDSLPDPVPPGFVRGFQASTVYVPLPSEFMEVVIAESLKLPARVWREVMMGMLVTEPVFGIGSGTTVPTLLLWGERDAVMPRSEQEALLGAIPGASLKVYPATGHALHWERPAEFARDFQAFVERTQTSGNRQVQNRK